MYKMITVSGPGITCPCWYWLLWILTRSLLLPASIVSTNFLTALVLETNPLIQRRFHVCHCFTHTPTHTSRWRRRSSCPASPANPPPSSWVAPVAVATACSGRRWPAHWAAPWAPCPRATASTPSPVPRSANPPRHPGSWWSPWLSKYRLVLVESKTPYFGRCQILVKNAKMHRF